MKKNLFFIFALIILSTAGLLLDRNADKSENASFSLANIEALTDQEEGEPATPPEFWHYVPDKYIEPRVEEFKLICATEGHLEVKGFSISGNFSRGIEYAVIVETKSCDGVQKGAWCDQRMVGSQILSVTSTSSPSPQP